MAGDTLKNALLAAFRDGRSVIGSRVRRLSFGCRGAGAGHRRAGATGGTHLWSRRYGDPSTQQNAALAVDNAGNILVGGSFYGTVDLGLGGGALVSAGGADVFLAKLDPNGEHVWSKRFGDAED